MTPSCAAALVMPRFLIGREPTCVQLSPPSVEAMTGDGETTTGDGTDGTTVGQAIIPIRFDSTDRANSYRVTVTFENSDIGTVSETQVGA